MSKLSELIKKYQDKVGGYIGGSLHNPLAGTIGAVTGKDRPFSKGLLRGHGIGSAMDIAGLTLAAPGLGGIPATSAPAETAGAGIKKRLLTDALSNSFQSGMQNQELDDQRRRQYAAELRQYLQSLPQYEPPDFTKYQRRF